MRKFQNNKVVMSALNSEVLGAQCRLVGAVKSKKIVVLCPKP
jgi:hypothetical protein